MSEKVENLIKNWAIGFLLKRMECEGVNQEKDISGSFWIVDWLSQYICLTRELAKILVAISHGHKPPLSRQLMPHCAYVVKRIPSVAPLP